MSTGLANAFKVYVNLYLMSQGGWFTVTTSTYRGEILGEIVVKEF